MVAQPAGDGGGVLARGDSPAHYVASSPVLSLTCRDINLTHRARPAVGSHDSCSDIVFRLHHGARTAGRVRRAALPSRAAWEVAVATHDGGGASGRGGGAAVLCPAGQAARRAPPGGRRGEERHLTRPL